MKIRLLFLSLLFCVFAQVQGQDNQCAAQASRVDSLVVAKDFNKGLDVWKSARMCKVESLFRNGEILLTNKLAMKLSAAEKADYAAMLLQLYTDYDKNFPGNKNSNAVKKALYLYRQDATNVAVFDLLDRAFMNDRENFTDANALQIYFSQYYSRFKSGDKNVTEDNVLAKKDDVSAHLEQLFTDTKNNDYRLVSEGNRKLIATIATCEKLDQYYGKQFDTKKNDSNWLQAVAESLSTDCQQSPFYYKAAAEWQAKRPNSKSAFHLAQASLQQRKRADAMKYFEESAAAETDLLQKAETYYAMAVLEITDGPKAILLLQQSLKAKPDFGKAYLLLAEVYASSDCGKTPFEKKARYLLAAQTALKAAKVEAGLKKTAESQAAVYNKKAPTTAEIKDVKMSGKTVTYACGINESVTLP